MCGSNRALYWLRNNVYMCFFVRESAVNVSYVFRNNCHSNTIGFRGVFGESCAFVEKGVVWYVVIL